MNLKKLALSAFAAACLALGMTSYADNINVYYNGIKLEFDKDPVIINDRTMVPMRKIFETFGAEVIWHEDTKMIEASYGYINAIYNINFDKCYVNGMPVQLDSPPVLIDGYTFVPLRTISENFLQDVLWDETTKSVYIYPSAASQPKESVDLYGMTTALLNKWYDGEKSELLDFYNSDPTKTDWAKQIYATYERKGKKEADDAYGRAAANTGGYANSYASALRDEILQEYKDMATSEIYKQHDEYVSDLSSELTASYNKLYNMIEKEFKDTVYYDTPENYLKSWQSEFELYNLRFPY